MKTTKALIIVCVLVLLGATYYWFVTHKQKISVSTIDKQETANPYLNSKIESKTFQSTDKTWGYDIFIDDHLYVHQPNIPAVEGDLGFKAEAEAQKMADLVIDKIKHNILPPSISTQELKDLGII